VATLQDMIGEFQSILNRDDCSNTQAQTFIQQAISRIQRTARLPSMERLFTVTTVQATDYVGVPSDLIQIIDIYVPDRLTGRPRALRKAAYRDLMQMDPNLEPTAYARLQAQLWMRGVVPAATTITGHYYGEFTPFASLSAANELSTSSPDLAVYGALSYAGDSYLHPSTEQWEARYQAILAEVTQQAIDVEMEGGPASVQPMFSEDY
jgi:hypothetical protein